MSPERQAFALGGTNMDAYTEYIRCCREKVDRGDWFFNYDVYSDVGCKNATCLHFGIARMLYDGYGFHIDGKPYWHASKRQASEYCKFMNVGQVSRGMRRLIKSGYISKNNLKPEEIKSLCTQKSNIIHILSGYDKCDWCGCRSITMNEHHYPIRANAGGEDVVLICPDCHYSYHYIESNSYLIDTSKFKYEWLDFFDRHWGDNIEEEI